METLILDYKVCPVDRIELTPALRRAGGREEIWSTFGNLPGCPEAISLARQVHDTLKGAIEVATGCPGRLDLEAARGHLEQIRKSGEQLREALLPKELVSQLHDRPSIRHILFRYSPLLNGIPFDLMFLWDDFLGFRYATGKQPLGTYGRSDPIPHGTEQTGYRGYALVDPARLLVAQGATKLRQHDRQYRDDWDMDTHPLTSCKLNQLINFDDGVRFQDVTVEEIIDALRHHDIVEFVAHHHFDADQPEGGGFQISANLAFTPRDLLNSFRPSDLPDSSSPAFVPPRLLFSIGCRSGITKGWENDWPANKRLHGIVDAALRAGIRHYVGTLVKIPTERSPDLRLAFYRELAHGGTVGEAMRVARCALRADPNNALDGATVLGLAFVLYGDPDELYFCAQGHRLDDAPVLTCKEVGCGAAICPREEGFGHQKCGEHWKTEQITCSAGHVVEDLSQLQVCKECFNTLCPTCSGFGKQLCWEHCCYEGHKIIGEAKKICENPQGRHKGEKRSVCPLDDGWMRELCRECLAAFGQAGEEQPSCEHSGLRVGENNPWAGVCEDAACGRQMCKEVFSWYEQTLYCPDSTRPRQERDTGWMRALDRRGQSDIALATQARLHVLLAISQQFRAGIVTNVMEQTRRWSLMPKFRLSAWGIIWPEARVLGVKQSVADLSKPLVTRLRQRWSLPPDRNGRAVWQPPQGWLDDYQNSNQMETHLVRSTWGSSIVVAVAILTPVEFQSGKGPTLVPCDADHLRIVEETLDEWCRTEKIGTDVYFVVHSATGWAKQVEPTYRPGRVTVLAELKGSQWSLRPPALDGMCKRVSDFVRTLTPETVYRRWQRIREWIEGYLESSDFVTLFQTQKELEKDGPPVGEREVQQVFDQLQDTGRFRQEPVNRQPALRPASRAERSAHLTRRWWLETVAAFAGVTAALTSWPVWSSAIPFITGRWGSLALGIMISVLICHLLSQGIRKAVVFLQQK